MELLTLHTGIEDYFNQFQIGTLDPKMIEIEDLEKELKKVRQIAKKGYINNEILAEAETNLMYFIDLKIIDRLSYL
jgi:hypothetical protein